MSGESSERGLRRQQEAVELRGRGEEEGEIRNDEAKSHEITGSRRRHHPRRSHENEHESGIADGLAREDSSVVARHVLSGLKGGVGIVETLFGDSVEKTGQIEKGVRAEKSVGDEKRPEREYEPKPAAGGSGGSERDGEQQRRYAEKSRVFYRRSRSYGGTGQDGGPGRAPLQMEERREERTDEKRLEHDVGTDVLARIELEVGERHESGSGEAHSLVEPLLAQRVGEDDVQDTEPGDERAPHFQEMSRGNIGERRPQSFPHAGDERDEVGAEKHVEEEARILVVAVVQVPLFEHRQDRAHEVFFVSVRAVDGVPGKGREPAPERVDDDDDQGEGCPPVPETREPTERRATRPLPPLPP